jgi:hypothetical protein
MASGLTIAANSTTTPLASGATFTGTWTNCAFFSSVVIACLTDQAGTLYVDFSPDGSNVDSTLGYSVAASTNEVHRLLVTREYFRVRLTNTSAASQTYIRLEAIVGEQGLLSSPLNTIIQQDADAVVVRVIDFEFDIAAGRSQGVSIVNKFGKNPDVDTGTVPEDIWENGGTYTGFPAGAAETLQVFSSSANDAAAGTGARTIRVTGLDSNYNIISETVTLNGVTPVTTSQSFIRAHTAVVLTSGSSNTAFNAGNITVRHSTTTTNIFLYMLIGTNQTNCSGYTIPAGYTGYMRKITVSCADGASASVQGSIYVGAFGAAPRYRRPFIVTFGAQLSDEIYGGLVFPEKTDIILRITSCSANNTVVLGGYDLILVAN